MLNNHELSAILKENIPANVAIEDIHWRSQDSTSGSLLFYRLASDQKSIDTFLERIKNSQYGWLVINRNCAGLPERVSVIDEKLWPELQKQVLDKLYPLPNLKLIGITGTNGKTTTTDLVLQLGFLQGKKGISIGTLGVREYHKTLLDFGLTSPSFIDLRKFLHTFGQDKDFCVMEASSHALVQDRLHGISLDTAGWLSFSQDHLDYHQSMDAYFAAKTLIFEKLKPGARLFVPAEQKDLFEKIRKASPLVAYAPEILVELPLFFRTQFNKNNLEVARALIEEVFGPMQIDFHKLQAPDGRFYIQSYKTNYIVVDFAHSPDALENICRAIKETFPGYALKVLFGCGGDRDRSKRPKMAEVVSKWADEIYVTSDNPRSENPDQIIADILTGIQGKKFQAITDRPQAVKLAFSQLTDKEVLLLAGKGHEDYILINGVKHPYSDIGEVDAFIARTKP